MCSSRIHHIRDSVGKTHQESEQALRADHDQELVVPIPDEGHTHFIIQGRWECRWLRQPNYWLCGSLIACVAAQCSAEANTTCPNPATCTEPVGWNSSAAPKWHKYSVL